MAARTAAPVPPAPSLIGLRGDLVGRRAAYAWASIRQLLWPRARARRLLLPAYLGFLVLAYPEIVPGASLGDALVVVLGCMASLLAVIAAWMWGAPPTPRRVLYATPDGDAVMRVQAKRKKNLWDINNHVKLHPDADARGLRAELLPHLLREARDQGVSVTLTAAAEQLAETYEREVLDAQKDIANPIPLRRVRRRWPRPGIGMRWDPPRL